MGILRGGGRSGEARVVLGEVNGAKEFVGVGDRGDISEAELLDKAILEGAEKAFDASLGLGREGGENLDVELAHGAAELGEWRDILKILIDGGLLVDAVDGVSIDVEGAGAGMLKEVGFSGGEQMEGIL